MVSQTPAEIKPKLKDWIRPKGNDLSEDAALQFGTVIRKVNGKMYLDRPRMSSTAHYGGLASVRPRRARRSMRRF